MHFDITVVIELIQATIMEKKTTQKIVLLEGMCNSVKLVEEDD